MNGGTQGGMAPNNQTASFTDFSVSNSVWPRTTKNGRYGSTHFDPNTIKSLSGLNDGHPRRVDEFTQHSSNF